ncbi:hypothetical protein [Salinivibrio socompensis]|uniref:hypothetical protein n=1 Tax=Salinivibrio socompensis TaxID=1510206 RepID=UPI0004ACE3DE
MTGTYNEAVIENKTYDEISIGDEAFLEKRLTMQDIKLFAIMSGDVNPAHVMMTLRKAAVSKRLSPTVCGAAH